MPDRGLSEVREFESPSETKQRSLENTDVDEGFRLDKNGDRDDSTAGRATGHHHIVPSGQANDSRAE